MAGPWRNPKSDIWYFRKATPTGLKSRKADLEVLGETVKGERQISLETTDLKEAKEKYKYVEQQVEAEWDRLRLRLAANPTTLSHKQMMALATEDVKSFLKKHDDNPQFAPSPQRIIAASCENLIATRTDWSLPERQSAFELSLRLQDTPFAKLPKVLLEAQNTENSEACLTVIAAIAQAVQIYHETVGWWRAKELTRAKGIVLNAESQKRLAEQTASDRVKAYEVLSARLEGDYSEPEFLKSRPKYTAPETKKQTAPKTSFQDVIDNQKLLGDQDLRKQRKSPKTFEKYGTDTKQFAEFRKSDDVETVTRSEVEKWRDNMLAEGSLKAKTIAAKVDNLQAVIGWHIKHTHEDAYDGKNPVKHVLRPEHIQQTNTSKAFSRKQAAQILMAARQEVEAHKRWPVWIMAYTGMRVGEVAQLEERDLIRIGSYWFLHVRVDRERSTKTHVDRKVPIHPDLEKEGLIKFIQAKSQGSLFPNDKGQSRKETLSGSLIRWFQRLDIHPEENQEKVPTSHGFRYMFEDIILTRLPETAARFMTGRVIKGSVKDYIKGSDDALVDLAEHVSQLPSIIGNFGR